MELQLGLALPTNNPIKDFDLNLNTYAIDHVHNDTAQSCLNDPISKKRRSFSQSEYFELGSAFRRTLPLIVWNNQPNDDEDDDDRKDLDHAAVFPNEKYGENGLVGWPPLRTRRKRLYVKKLRNAGGGRVVAVENRRPVLETTAGGCGINDRVKRSNYSQFVKVKMEGVGIARKIDLSLYNSFAELRATLMNMFDEKDLSKHRLTYQDMDGDWLLAEDITWRSFIGTVQKIQLEKKDG